MLPVALDYNLNCHIVSLKSQCQILATSSAMLGLLEKGVLCSGCLLLLRARARFT